MGCLKQKTIPSCGRLDHSIPFWSFEKGVQPPTLQAPLCAVAGWLATSHPFVANLPSMLLSEIPPELGDEFENVKYIEPEILYPHHIPTTWFQKGLLAIGSGLAAFLDPKRDG